MKRTITARGGRAPPGQNTRRPSAESHSPASAHGPRAPDPSIAGAHHSCRPLRWPVSRSACRTHRRRVSAVHPSLLAIDAIAAHCEACSVLCSRTLRTARSRTSGEYRLGRAIEPILSRNRRSRRVESLARWCTLVTRTVAASRGSTRQPIPRRWLAWSWSMPGTRTASCTSTAR